jgi:hypothetical protein
MSAEPIGPTELESLRAQTEAHHRQRIKELQGSIERLQKDIDDCPDRAKRVELLEIQYEHRRQIGLFELRLSKSGIDAGA